LKRWFVNSLSIDFLKVPQIEGLVLQVLVLVNGKDYLVIFSLKDIIILFSILLFLSDFRFSLLLLTFIDFLKVDIDSLILGIRNVFDLTNLNIGNFILLINDGNSLKYLKLSLRSWNLDCFLIIVDLDINSTFINVYLIL
jgi:hypothetical protein